jgi:hypothetical protein
MSYDKYRNADNEQKTTPMPSGSQPAEQQIRVDGFEQVLAMLRIADAEFRESILRRLAARDQQLARDLRRELGI